jgi:excisionase family DNA binding protein
VEKLGVGIAEAAEMLSVSIFTIRRAVKRGELRVTKVGRRSVIPVSELHRILHPIADSSTSESES